MTKISTILFAFGTFGIFGTVGSLEANTISLSEMIYKVAVYAGFILLAYTAEIIIRGNKKIKKSVKQQFILKQVKMGGKYNEK